MEDAFTRNMLAEGPHLRAFAISLAGNGDRADDLVQETFLRAIANKDSFQDGTNLPAWLFTILRNLFRSEYRKRRREVEDADGSYAKTLKTQPQQSPYMDFQDLKVALTKLPPEQYEAILLVGASGFSYEDAAHICECAIGTIKSRVNRAREKLHRTLDAFDLRELNKKSWDEPDDAEFFGEEPKPDWRKPIWKERQTPRKAEIDALLTPPTPVDPIPAIDTTPPKEIAAMPESAPVQTADLKTIVVEGTQFVFWGTATLPNGETQDIYQAA